MKEEEPVDGKKSEDDGIEKENLAILEKIRKNQRQDHLNVSCLSGKCSCHALVTPLKNIHPTTLNLCRLLTSDSILVIYKAIIFPRRTLKSQNNIPKWDPAMKVENEILRRAYSSGMFPLDL